MAALIGQSQPWGIIGDFNVCLGPLEASNGTNWNAGMIEFKDFIAQQSLSDLRCTGPVYTWWDCKVHSPSYKKLDRCLVNGAWLGKYALSHARVLPRGLSDHCPVTVSLGIQYDIIRRPFAFFNHLIRVPEFLDEVRSAWNIEVRGDPWFILTSKLKRVKDAMRRLNTSKGNLHSEVEETRSALLSFQEALPAMPSSDLYEEEKKLIQDYCNALQLEEIFLKQKSRVNWLKSGDSNNRFFFNS